MKHRALRLLIQLIGPVLLVVFLLRTDLGALASAFRQIAIGPVLLSLALFPVFLIVKAYRWNLVLRELGVEPPPLRETSELYAIGLYAGGVTPGQSGDLIKAWYMKERGAPLPVTLFSIVLDRLFDFVIMAILALLGIVAFVDAFPPAMRQPLTIATVVFAVIVFASTPLMMARASRERLFGIFTPLLPARFRPAVEKWRAQFAGLSMRPALLVVLIAASIGSALSTIVRIWLLFQALPLAAVPLTTIVACTAIISILQALPISFAGVGVRDAVLVAALARYGYSTELALTLSALFLLLNIEHILLGFLVSLRRPLGRTPPPNFAEEVPGSGPGTDAGR